MKRNVPCLITPGPYGNTCHYINRFWRQNMMQNTGVCCHSVGLQPFRHSSLSALYEVAQTDISLKLNWCKWIVTRCRVVPNLDYAQGSNCFGTLGVLIISFLLLFSRDSILGDILYVKIGRFCVECKRRR